MPDAIDKTVAAWKENLAAQIKAFLETTDTSRQDVATKLGYRPSMVSMALNNPSEKMSDQFVAKLSRNYRQFKGAIDQLRMIKDAKFAAPDERDAIIRREEERQAQIADIRTMIAQLQTMLDRLMNQQPDADGGE